MAYRTFCCSFEGLHTHLIFLTGITATVERPSQQLHFLLFIESTSFRPFRLLSKSTSLCHPPPWLLGVRGATSGLCLVNECAGRQPHCSGLHPTHMLSTSLPNWATVVKIQCGGGEGWLAGPAPEIRLQLFYACLLPNLQGHQAVSHPHAITRTCTCLAPRKLSRTSIPHTVSTRFF